MALVTAQRKLFKKSYLKNEKWVDCKILHRLSVYTCALRNNINSKILYRLSEIFIKDWSKVQIVSVRNVYYLGKYLV